MDYKHFEDEIRSEESYNIHSNSFRNEGKMGDLMRYNKKLFKENQDLIKKCAAAKRECEILSKENKILRKKADKPIVRNFNEGVNEVQNQPKKSNGYSWGLIIILVVLGYMACRSR